MKKIFILLLLLPFVFGCENQTFRYDNPNIPNYMVNLQINMNLPSYNSLQFPGNYIVDMSQGAGGIVVFNTGSGFNAFDLACPNHPYTTSQTPMTIIGIDAKCSYDNSIYSLYTGQGIGQPYPMKPYRVEVNGTNLYVTN